MRPIDIRAPRGRGGWTQAKASFRKNYVHYLQEALGLACFMVAACSFASLLWAKAGWLHQAVPNAQTRMFLMGLAMGSTALIVFYSPLTAPSGSHINPAVTLTFLRLGKMCYWDALFYILFQLAGGIAAVYVMVLVLGPSLTDPPVRVVATVPGKGGWGVALGSEYATGLLMMSWVLFSHDSTRLSRYTRVLAAALVCVFVIVAGPLSGFGNNPARTLASAVVSGVWTGWWLYMIAPLLGMLSAAELFVLVKKRKS